MPMTALTEPERLKRADLEGVIERGMQTFVEVGSALRLIRDGRLYRTTHTTFEEYCQERWGWDRRHANRHIEAADIVDSLGSIDPKPLNVGQARELAKVPEEKRTEVWEDAVQNAPTKNGKPAVTAAHVREAAKDAAPLFMDRVRKGMECSGNADEMADAVGITPRSFRRARYVLLLMDEPKLTAKQKESVIEAHDRINSAGKVTDAVWVLVEPVVEAKYGTVDRRRGSGSLKRAAETREEDFVRAYSTIIQVCMAAPEISVPVLHQEDRARIKSEIGIAIDKLKDLRRRVGTKGAV